MHLYIPSPSFRVLMNRKCVVLTTPLIFNQISGYSALGIYVKNKGSKIWPNVEGISGFLVNSIAVS